MLDDSSSPHYALFLLPFDIQLLVQIDLSLFSDVLDTAQIPKVELVEANKIFEEHCRDLYKIFSYYSHNPTTISGSSNSLSVNSPTEVRMGNSEFWRFVRDSKLKLQQTILSQINMGEEEVASGRDAARFIHPLHLNFHILNDDWFF